MWKTKLAILKRKTKNHRAILGRSKKDLLQQRFRAVKPNQVWISDVTCYKLKDSYYYICVIYSRKAVIQEKSTQLLTGTFKQEWNLRSPSEGVISRSDGGSSYLSFSFQSLL